MKKYLLINETTYMDGYLYEVVDGKLNEELYFYEISEASTELDLRIKEIEDNGYTLVKIALALEYGTLSDCSIFMKDGELFIYDIQGELLEFMLEEE